VGQERGRKYNVTLLADEDAKAIKASGLLRISFKTTGPSDLRRKGRVKGAANQQGGKRRDEPRDEQAGKDFLR